MNSVEEKNERKGLRVTFQFLNVASLKMLRWKIQKQEIFPGKGGESGKIRMIVIKCCFNKI